MAPAGVGGFGLTDGNGEWSFPGLNEGDFAVAAFGCDVNHLGDPMTDPGTGQAVIPTSYLPNNPARWQMADPIFSGATFYHPTAASPIVGIEECIGCAPSTPPTTTTTTTTAPTTTTTTTTVPPTTADTATTTAPPVTTTTTAPPAVPTAAASAAPAFPASFLLQLSNKWLAGLERFSAAAKSKAVAASTQLPVPPTVYSVAPVQTVVEGRTQSSIGHDSAAASGSGSSTRTPSEMAAVARSGSSADAASSPATASDDATSTNGPAARTDADTTAPSSSPASSSSSPTLILFAGLLGLGAAGGLVAARRRAARYA
jgi:hypothetical protein